MAESTFISIPLELHEEHIETRKVLKRLPAARAALAELKGAAATIPNEHILIDTLSLQEARDSSAIENIVTTHDEVYRSSYQEEAFATPAAKEVHKYADALKNAFASVRSNGIITLQLILDVQATIEGNRAGLRKVPGTQLRNDATGEVIYTPPQHPDEIRRLMDQLLAYIHDDNCGLDPLVKMALVHHHFESIHPFYDGNGRTGRVLNILMLIREDLLQLPILYLSKYIIAHRADYYTHLQGARDKGDWEAWICFMLDAVTDTAQRTVKLIQAIKALMQRLKQRLRSEHPVIYSQDLMNNLFRHPYTKIAIVQHELQVSRPTAIRYLNTLVEMGILHKTKIGRSNFYINVALFELLTHAQNTNRPA